MMVFRNDYEADGRPICPQCSGVVRIEEPAARSDDAVAHLRCVWSARFVSARDAEPDAASDAEMGAFFAAITRVLRRIGAVRTRRDDADFGTRPAA